MVTSPYRRNILEWAIKQQTNNQSINWLVAWLIWIIFKRLKFLRVFFLVVVVVVVVVVVLIGGGAHRCVQVVCSWSIDTGLFGKSWMYERAVSYKSSYHDIDIYSIPLTFKEILRLTSPQVLR